MAGWMEKIRQNHLSMMILCCVIPLAVLAGAVYFFGLSKTYITWFAILLCPIMHIFMMRDMHKEHKKDAGNAGDTESSGKKSGGGCH